MGVQVSTHSLKSILIIMSLEEQFKTAADTISNKINKTMTDEELKEVYGLYKQGTLEDCDIEKPGMLDVKGGAKWEAWNAVKGLSKEEAQQKYIDFTAKMVETHGLA